MAIDRRAFLCRAAGLGGGALATLVVAGCATGGDRRAGTPTTSRGTLSTSTTAPAGAVGATAALTAADFTGLGGCTLVPEKTAGPFPLDRQLPRRDVTEGLAGHPLRLGLRVVGVRDSFDACVPRPGARVEIWHCDATGDYSAFVDGGGGKDAGPGTTFLRGTQTADAAGIVEFATIYPGWYRGRAVHIHLRVHEAGRTTLTSQLFFPDAYTESVYASAPYARFGNPDTPNAQDSIAGDPAAEGTLLAVSRGETGRGPGTVGLLNLGVAA